MKGASKSFQVCVLLLITLSAWLAFQGRGKPHDYQGKEALVHIRSGQSSSITYGLYQAGSINSEGRDNLRRYEFVLLLRNTGAKFVPMGSVTANNIKLVDAKNREMQVDLLASPDGGIAKGYSTLVQFSIHRTLWFEPPFSLTFRSGTNVHEQFSLGIEKFTPAVRK